MPKFIFFVLVGLLVSCALPNYTYVFDLPDAAVKKSSSTSGFLHPYREALTASVSNEISHPFITTEDTLIQLNDSTSVLADSLQQLKSDTKVAPPSTKEERKKVYLEKKRAYQEIARARPSTKEGRKNWNLEKKEAYTEMKKALAATKDKRLDGYAISGAILLTAAILCMVGYVGAAIALGVIGLYASIMGLKSRIWGLSAAMIIGSTVILSLYIFLSIMMSGPE